MAQTTASLEWLKDARPGTLTNAQRKKIGNRGKAFYEKILNANPRFEDENFRKYIVIRVADGSYMVGEDLFTVQKEFWEKYGKTEWCFTQWIGMKSFA